MSSFDDAVRRHAAQDEEATATYARHQTELRLQAEDAVITVEAALRDLSQYLHRNNAAIYQLRYRDPYAGRPKLRRSAPLVVSPVGYPLGDYLIKDMDRPKLLMAEVLTPEGRLWRYNNYSRWVYKAADYDYEAGYVRIDTETLMEDKLRVAGHWPRLDHHSGKIAVEVGIPGEVNHYRLSIVDYLARIGLDVLSREPLPKQFFAPK
ncbi:hypothetical protein SAMN04488583_6376 [Mycobacterium sp. 88mf]|nr:hypothetical protein SAMN04488583_6376 [Mycobacterium sp. 88mf]SFG61541.1 hypothetical protein SAMN04488582_11076 [Mycobacterium sp. 455mf]